MEPDVLYAELSALIASAPEIPLDINGPILDREILMWLGRAEHLVTQTANRMRLGEFRLAQMGLGEINHRSSVGTIMRILYGALAAAEAKAPAAARGAFIPAANPFDALQAIKNVLISAEKSVVIIDPYMDANTVTDFVPLANEGVLIGLLADAHYAKPGLRPTASAWVRQYAERPISLKLAPARTLHDRLILIDNRSAWTLTQSLNAFATRAPASVLRASEDVAASKIAAYEVIWDTAVAIDIS